MTEKNASKHLINLQSTFAVDNPVLQNAVKVFHELDQFEFDLGLLEEEETTAIQTSWWPIISVVGGNSGAKETFLARYLKVELSPTHKTTVLLHNAGNQTILPATALDVDFRYPFYRISQKLEQIQKGEGERINANLEMRTVSSARLQGKLIIDIPNFIHATNYEVSNLLTTYSMEQSDVVLVFCDIFNSTTDLAKALTQTLIKQQESNKLVYLFDDSLANAQTWQKKLADLGLTIGQFIGISQTDNPNSPDFALLEQRLANAGLQRNYRVLHSLEKSINDLENVVIAEVKQGISIWKDRSTFSSLLVLGFIVMLMVFAEVAGLGFLELLFDPIVGIAIVLSIAAFMLPLHIMFSKMLAKVTTSYLVRRQKQLQLTENLAALFEQDLGFKRMLLPIFDPVGWNKKSKARLNNLLARTKELVQSLNDNFSLYSTASVSIQPVARPAVVTPQPAPVIQPEPAPQVAVTPVVEQPIPTFVAPEPVMQVAPQLAPAPVAETAAPQQPQRQSTLMQKFARK